MKNLTTLINFCFLLLFTTTLKAEEVKVEIKKILAFETADWNKDGKMDKAVIELPKNEDDTVSTLYIYLSGDKAGSALKKESRAITWTGNMAGTLPALSINKSGSLVIHSMNQSIGRDRWHQKLTISYRNDAFIVAGFSFSSYDTLNHDNNRECDVNLLSGKGERDGKPFRIEVKKRPLLDWDENQAPKQCFE